MGRYIWGGLFAAACLLAAFLVFIVFQRIPDLSPEDGKALMLKGFVLAGGILLIGSYPLLKMRQRGRAEAKAEPSAPVSPEAELLASIPDDEETQ